MRNRAWVKSFLVSLAAVFAVGLFTAPSAAAVCIGGQDFIGASPTGPIQVGDSAYSNGINQYSVPEWYGYGAPPVTAWYDNYPQGIINPGDNLCSTTDFGAFFNQAVPEGLTSVTAGLLGIDYALLDGASFSAQWVSDTQNQIRNVINSGPYSALYEVLMIAVIGLGIITIMMLVLTQDQRERSDLMRVLDSGSGRGRRSAAIKEAGWIFLSIAIFGAILGGLPYNIQKVVTDISSSFTTAIEGELTNLATVGFGKSADGYISNICAKPSVSSSLTDVNTAIKCNMYRIYQWTPWLVIQFGGTDASVYEIDSTNNFITESEPAKRAIEQTRAKFGDEAATLAPYIQMQILRGNNNEYHSKTPELSGEDRFQAFKDFGLAIDASKSSQSWAVHWAGQGDAKASRAFNALITLGIVIIAVFPLLTLTLLAGVVAGIGAAILPLFGLFFAVLIGLRQTRRKGMRILKWWIYCIAIPPLVAVALSLSLTMALLITSYIDFTGLSLFLYLIISSAIFVGILLYLITLFWGQRKTAAAAVGASDDGNPGLIAKAAPAVGAIAGNIIAPGIGGAIGGAVGSTVAGGEEPRPDMGGDEGGGEVPRPVLASNTAALAIGAGEPRVGSQFTSPDDEIIDAEIIDDYEPYPFGGRPPAPMDRIGQQSALPAVSDYGDEPRVLPPGVNTGYNTDSSEGARQIQDIVDEGVERIMQATAIGSSVVDAVARDRMGRVFDGAEEASATFSEVADQLTRSSEQQLGMAAAEQRSSMDEHVEGSRARLFRHSSSAEESVKAMHDAATVSISNIGQDLGKSLDQAAMQLSAASGEAEDAALTLIDGAELAEDAAVDIKKSLEKRAQRGQ